MLVLKFYGGYVFERCLLRSFERGISTKKDESMSKAQKTVFFYTMVVVNLAFLVVLKM